MHAVKQRKGVYIPIVELSVASLYKNGPRDRAPIPVGIWVSSAYWNRGRKCKVKPTRKQDRCHDRCSDTVDRAITIHGPVEYYLGSRE